VLRLRLADALKSRGGLRPRAQPAMEPAPAVLHRRALTCGAAAIPRATSRRRGDIPRRVAILQPPAPWLKRSFRHLAHPSPSAPRPRVSLCGVSLLLRGKRPAAKYGFTSGSFFDTRVIQFGWTVQVRCLSHPSVGDSSHARARRGVRSCAIRPAGVRHPLKPRPGGRASAVAVLEPDETQSVDAVSRRRGGR
jgi:hypothetical protein